MFSNYKCKFKCNSSCRVRKLQIAYMYMFSVAFEENKIENHIWYYVETVCYRFNCIIYTCILILWIVRMYMLHADLCKALNLVIGISPDIFLYYIECDLYCILCLCPKRQFHIKMQYVKGLESVRFIFKLNTIIIIRLCISNGQSPISVSSTYTEHTYINQNIHTHTRQMKVYMLFYI